MRYSPEGSPPLGGCLIMCDPIDIFARRVRYLGLDNLFPWLACLVREEVSVHLKGICSLHDDDELCNFKALMAFLYPTLTMARRDGEASEFGVDSSPFSP